MSNQPLTLDADDPRVIAARNAERELFNYYGLQFTEHYIYLPEHSIKVRVQEIGTGKPLLVVPGNTGDVFPIAGLLAKLKGYRIIAVNRPGGGLSEGIDHNTVDIRKFAVSVLLAVLDAFSLVSTDILAHSMGAHWSLWLAMDKPERVKSLALLGNPGNVLGGGPPLLVRLLTKPPFSKLLVKILIPKDKSKALRALKTMGHSAATLAAQPAALRDCYYYFRLLPHYQLAALSLLQNGAPDIDGAQLARVTQPVILLLGTKDTFASVGHGKRIVAAMPHGRLHVIYGAGHLPWIEAEDECGRMVREFIA